MKLTPPPSSLQEDFFPPRPKSHSLGPLPTPTPQNKRERERLDRQSEREKGALYDRDGGLASQAERSGRGGEETGARRGPPLGSHAPPLLEKRGGRSSAPQKLAWVAAKPGHTWEAGNPWTHHGRNKATGSPQSWACPRGSSHESQPLTRVTRLETSCVFWAEVTRDPRVFLSLEGLAPSAGGDPFLDT